MKKWTLLGLFVIANTFGLLLCYINNPISSHFEPALITSMFSLGGSLIIAQKLGDD